MGDSSLALNTRHEMAFLVKGMAFCWYMSVLFQILRGFQIYMSCWEIFSPLRLLCAALSEKYGDKVPDLVAK